GKHHCDSCARATQKEEDHQSGEHQSDAAFVKQVLDRLLHEQRLVKNDVGDELLGHVGQSGDCLLDAIDHGDGVAVTALLHHRQVNGFLSVDADDVLLYLL